MAIAFVQSTTGGRDGAGQGVTVSLTSTTAGNKLLVFASEWQAQNNVSGVSTISSTPSATWRQDQAGIPIDTTTALQAGRAQIWSADITTGGTVTVNLTFVGNNTYATVLMAEFSGLATGSTSLDQTTQNSGANATPAGLTTATTTQAAELVVANLALVGSSTTSGLLPAAGQGYTNLGYNPDGTSRVGWSAEYKIVSATGTQSASWGTLNTDPYNEWSANIATYKALSTGITGTLSANLSKPTMAASGSSVAGSFAASLTKPTMVASGTFTLTGTLAANLSKPTMAASGSTVVGTLAATLGNASMVATGTAGSGVAGSLAAPLPLATLAGSGTFTQPTLTGSLAATLPLATMAALGSTIAGSLAASLTRPTMAASGSTIVGSFAASLPLATLVASGTVGSGNTGALAANLGKPTMTASGTASLPTLTGSLSALLTRPNMVAAGSVPVTGSLAANLTVPGLSGVGSNPYGLSIAPSPTWFGISNALATAVVTAGSAAAGMAAANVVGPDGCPAAGWQTAAGVTTSYLLGDTGLSTTVWRCVGIFKTNLTASATIRVRVGNAAMSSVSYDSGTLTNLIVPGYQQAVIVFPGDIQGAAVRIDIADSSNPDGFLNCPLAWAGPLLNPGIGLTYSSAVGRSATETVVRTRSGAEYVTPLYQQRSYAITYSALQMDAMFSVLEPVVRLSRGNGNLLYIPSDTTPSALSRQAIFGRLITVADVTYDKAGDDRRSWRGTMRERC